MDWYVYQRGSSPIRKVSGKRMRRRSHRKWVAAAMVPVAAGLVWCAYCLSVINGAKTAVPLMEADTAVVLGMAMWGDEPSPGLKERLDYSLQLYQEGKFRHFIVSGGLDREGYKYTEGEGMKNYLVAQGVPESAILVENEATSTYENLKFSEEIMKRENLQTAIIVTHDFHGRRSLEMAKELGYSRPELALTESVTMSNFKYKTREILAYTKWKVQQLFL
ncbi:YdcF family protein [Paenibacillus sp. NFR01]|uniref:YdcF family protein n=1 Tax=Paenibacillus sp. NFR01 TaxID=1566279 RepID=UPI0008CDD05B|nr:YdcF family protein [Paenibacillus sp. NFR01]SET33533.1 Uncharacterized SAM-binding protein YcdF, DUF218 family [Paenibacillus sp. NFR01]